MKKNLIIALQVVVVLIGIATLGILIWFPLIEGRATNLDWVSIYSDPFILYGYATSIVYFVILYKIFELLGYIGQQKAYSINSVKILKSIKFGAFLLAVLIVMAGIYIMTSHHEDDDPAGFIAICLVATFTIIGFATTAARFEKKLQNRLKKD